MQTFYLIDNTTPERMRREKTKLNSPILYSFLNGGSRFDREANDDVAFFRKQVIHDFNIITKLTVVFRIER